MCNFCVYTLTRRVAVAHFDRERERERERGGFREGGKKKDAGASLRERGEMWGDEGGGELGGERYHNINLM